MVTYSHTHTHRHLFKSVHELPGTGAAGASDKLQRSGASLWRSFTIFVATLTALQRAGFQGEPNIQSSARFWNPSRAFGLFISCSFGPGTKWMRLSVSFWASLLNTMWLYCHFDWLWMDHASVCKWGESLTKARCIPIYAHINNDTGPFPSHPVLFLNKNYKEKCKYIKKHRI